METNTNLEELLSKFENGTERYSNDPVFCSVIKSLLEEPDDLIPVIESLLYIIGDQKRRMLEIAPFPITLYINP